MCVCVHTLMCIYVKKFKLNLFCCEHKECDLYFSPNVLHELLKVILVHHCRLNVLCKSMGLMYEYATIK